MTKEQEAQQAQTIAEIKQEADELRKFYKERDLDSRQSDEVFDILGRSFKIVDSQAQKIAEQAKQIERLKSAHKIPCVHCDATGGFNVESTGEIITCERCGGAGYHLLTTDSKEVAR